MCKKKNISNEKNHQEDRRAPGDESTGNGGAATSCAVGPRIERREPIKLGPSSRISCRAEGLRVEVLRMQSNFQLSSIGRKKVINIILQEDTQSKE
jgi:hypothetical protein